ncbi:hypothetical protein L484_016333 [Morus notabilis]|uniref:Sec-independent protein translocase protein TatB n=1 Tax=Morus notabilis TaxID=981085 RepID=W9QDZ0_9ROSA|nr:uncharacterized protein LOC21399383 [Morus notabilis]XP_024023105.1 uncharacterized protein LOC21399383 [Morus notabilis]EXB29844.1 hypothetical protein L484_016333 [Morus notabilis]
MLGISYGELFLLIGATAALVGPKDLPIIARTAGRIAGRAIGYVQLARGQFENVMQQSQARQIHKELQDTMAQLEAIRYEIRSISLVNPGPLTRKMMDNPLENSSPINSGNGVFEKGEEEKQPAKTMMKDDSDLKTLESINLHSQATAYAKLAESEAVKTASFKAKLEKEKLGLFAILPISAESTGMLPNRKEKATGSDIVLEAVLEAEVAHNAKDFFSQPENQIPANP